MTRIEKVWAAALFFLAVSAVAQITALVLGSK